MDRDAARAFADAYRAHAGTCRAYASALPGDADDTTHDAFVKLCRRLADGQPMPSTPRAWLLRAVRTSALDIRRGELRRRRREQHALEPSQPSPPVDAAVHDALWQLPEREREAVVLRLWCDADFAQIAAEFVDRAAERLPELFAAAEAADAAELASLAHWLRGVSGSAGYGKIQAAAEHLEQQALRAKQDDELTAVLDGVRGQLESLSGLVQAARRGLPRSNAAFQI